MNAPGWLFLLPLLLVPMPATASDDDEESQAPQISDVPFFADVSREVGLSFVHWNGMSGEFYMPETVGAGGALFDYDGDGDLDLYLVQGALLGATDKIAAPSFPPPQDLPLKDRLYRNDLEVRDDGSRRLHLVDVTEESGIRSGGYGMGVTTGDFNNDGWIDLYVTNFGNNEMWRNEGNGTFTDVTRETGTDDPRWSVSASFVDYDRDGWLDLYVTSYVRFTFELHKTCRTASGARDYCGPMAYQDLEDRLFRNRGDGTFQDVTLSSGIHQRKAAGLGVVTVDLNGDNWLDLYVANDGMANVLWINQQDGSFRDEALLSGCAVNGEGRPEASMGVDVGDFDGDGDEDLFLSHLTSETHTLFVNQGEGLFEDRTTQTGLGAVSLQATGFGAGFLDLENDGCLDLVVLNGAVRTLETLLRQRDPYPLHQTNQLFRNLCTGHFKEVTQSGGPVFELSEVSRGAALGDVDNDGDTDVLVLNNNGPARLLQNQRASKAHWLGIRAVGGEKPRDRLGARIALWRDGHPALWRRVGTDGSYASAGDPRVIFGLGGEPQIGRVEIHWPEGSVEVWRNLDPNRYYTLRQGSGQRAP